MQSKAVGMKNLGEVIRDASQKLSIREDISDRYFRNFCYTLEAPQSKGLKTFYQDLFEHKLLHREVNVRFFG